MSVLTFPYGVLTECQGVQKLLLFIDALRVNRSEAYPECTLFIVEQRKRGAAS